jgi:hypothetical protein
VKITDTKAIKDSEQDLIDTITGDLDWDVIEKVLKERHQLELQDEIEYRNGDIVVYNNQIAYRINFGVKVTVSVLFDRNGECLAINTDGPPIIID